MLAIRMQRTGRKKLAQFRVVVQDSKYSPNSGRVVASLGHYNPHTKETVIDTEKTMKYIENGAQPSPRVVKLLNEQKVKLPSWVEKLDTKKKSETKNPEKLRKNQPETEEAPAEDAPNEEVSEDKADDKKAAEEQPKSEETDSASEDSAKEEADK